MPPPEQGENGYELDPLQKPRFLGHVAISLVQQADDDAVDSSKSAEQSGNGLKPGASKRNSRRRRRSTGVKDHDVAEATSRKPNGAHVDTNEPLPEQSGPSSMAGYADSDVIPSCMKTPSPVSVKSLDSFCRQIGAQCLQGRTPSRALITLATVARRAPLLELSAVPLLPHGESDVSLATAYDVSVSFSAPTESDILSLQGGELPVVRPSEASRKLFWHLLYGKRFCPEDLGEQMRFDAILCDTGSCGFLGCKNFCAGDGCGNRCDFRLEKVFASCEPPRIPPPPAHPGSLGQLEVLPDEALESIAKWLSPRDLAALSATCQTLRRVVMSFVPALRLRLYKHQAAAVWRMLDRERGPRPLMPPPLSIQFPAVSESDGHASAHYHVDMATGAVYAGVIENTVPDCRGGLFCDEPGLGKTITALALILKTLGQQAEPPPGYVKRLPAQVPERIGFQVSAEECEVVQNEEFREEMFISEGSLHFDDVCADNVASHLQFSGSDTTCSDSARLSEQDAVYGNQFHTNLKPFFYKQAHTGRYLPFGFDEFDALQRKARGLGNVVRRSLKTPDFHNPATGKGSLPVVSMASTPIYLSGATLVVVPPMLLTHWTDQIAMHVEMGALRVLSVKHVRQIPAAQELAFDYDVVVLSFNVLNAVYGAMREEAPSLLCVRFLRVILDEGHKLGASKTGITNFLRVCESLKAERRWIMTGTPTPNTPDTDVRNLHPLLQFIRDESYGCLDKDSWLKGVQRPYESFHCEALERLKDLLQRVMIRSSKNDISFLPKCLVRDVILDFSNEGATCYNELVLLARRNLYLCDWMSSKHEESLLNPKNAKSCIEFIENLRSACNFGGIIRVDFSMVDLGESLDLLYRESMRAETGLLTQVRPDDVQVHIPSDDRWWSSPEYAPSEFALRQSPFLSTAAREALVAKEALQAACTAAGRRNTSKSDEYQIANGNHCPVEPAAVASGQVESEQSRPRTGAPESSQERAGNLRNDLQTCSSTTEGTSVADKEVCKSEKSADEEILSLPLKLASSKSDGRIEVRGLIKEIGNRIINGSDCGACKVFCRLPIISTCGHVVCIDCFASNKNGCVVPQCDHMYALDKEGIPEQVIELQPSVDSDSWMPEWEESRSLKMDYILKRLDEISNQTVWRQGAWRSKRPKVIIFSQFRMHHLLLAMTLKNSKRYRDAYVELFRNERELTDNQKSESAEARASRYLQKFIHEDDKFILLLETKNGSVGLDLSFVEYIFLMEPIWDASLEQQVIARAHRLGARETVHVERLAMRGSIEENMLRISNTVQSGVHTHKRLAEVNRRSNLLKTLESVRVERNIDCSQRKDGNSNSPFVDDASTDSRDQVADWNPSTAFLDSDIPVESAVMFENEKMNHRTDSHEDASQQSDTATSQNSLWNSAPRQASYGFKNSSPENLLDGQARPKKKVRFAV